MLFQCLMRTSGSGAGGNLPVARQDLPGARERSGGGGNEFQRDAVHAIAQTGRTRPVLEHMSEMTAATPAMHFGARDQERAVGRRADRIVQRLIETRPAGPAFIFGFGGE